MEVTWGSFLIYCEAWSEEQTLVSDCDEPIDGGGVEWGDPIPLFDELLPLPARS